MKKMEMIKSSAELHCYNKKQTNLIKIVNINWYYMQYCMTKQERNVVGSEYPM